ncbi:MAG: hypothetical protein V3R80_00700 [Candidatus Tectomicrobia bacterium]
MTQEIRQTELMTNAAERGRDVYVRYTMTRGEGPVDLFPSLALASRYVIIVKELHDWRAEFYSQGVRLAIPEFRRDPTPAIAGYTLWLRHDHWHRVRASDSCCSYNDACASESRSTPSQSTCKCRGTLPG